MLSTKRLLFIVILFNSIHNSFASNFIINESYSYYTFNPSNIENFKSSLFSKSNINTHSGTYAAYTKWNIDWKYRWYINDKKCLIKDIKITLSIKYIFPSLDVTNNINEVKLRFKELNRNLVSHESVHASHGILAAKEISNYLHAITPISGCYSLKKNIKKNIDNTIRKYKTKDVEFDSNTAHVF